MTIGQTDPKPQTPSQALERHRDAIRALAVRHRVQNVWVFGSVLRREDTAESDLDLLVQPSEDTTLLDIGAFQVETSELLGIRVDVLTPGALPETWRNEVLAQAQPL